MALHIQAPAEEAANTPSPAAQRAATRIIADATRTLEPMGLLTVPEMLGKIRVSRKTLYDLVRRKQIPAIKLGRRVLFNWPDVEAALRRLQTQ